MHVAGFRIDYIITYIYICHKYIYIYTYVFPFFFLHHFLVVKCFIVVEWGCQATKKNCLKTSSNQALNAWWLVPPSVWLNLTVYQFIVRYTGICLGGFQDVQSILNQCMNDFWGIYRHQGNQTSLPKRQTTSKNMRFHISQNLVPPEQFFSMESEHFLLRTKKTWLAIQ